MVKPVTQALVLAGGEGTRLRPLTYLLPKPLLPLHDRPMLECTIRTLKHYGVKEIVLSLGYKADQVMDSFGDGSKLGVKILYSIEKNALGTGGAVRLAADKLDETFFATNADEITNVKLQKMAAFHQKKGGVATLYLHTVRDVTNFGVAKTRGDRITHFFEKPDPKKPPSHLINSGRYVFNKEILDYIGPGSQSLERNVFPQLAEKRLLCGYRARGVYWKTVNSFEQWDGVENDFKTGSLAWLSRICELT